MQAISRVCMRSILLIVSNPVEAMTYVAWKLRNIFWIYNVKRIKNRPSHDYAWLTVNKMWKSGFPAERVIGAGTTVDSARFRSLIAKKTEEPLESITGTLHTVCSIPYVIDKWSHAWHCLFLGMVIGGHGEFILPVWSSVTVCGGKNSEPLKKLMEDYPEKLKLQGIKGFGILDS